MIINLENKIKQIRFEKLDGTEGPGKDLTINDGIENTLNKDFSQLPESEKILGESNPVGLEALNDLNQALSEVDESQSIIDRKQIESTDSFNLGSTTTNLDKSAINVPFTAEETDKFNLLAEMEMQGVPLTPKQQTELDSFKERKYGKSETEENNFVKSIIQPEETKQNNITETVEVNDWDSGKRPDGYKDTTESLNELDDVNGLPMRLLDVVGDEKAKKYKSLVLKIKDKDIGLNGLTSEEKKELIELSIEINKNAKELTEKIKSETKPVNGGQEVKPQQVEVVDQSLEKSKIDKWVDMVAHNIDILARVPADIRQKVKELADERKAKKAAASPPPNPPPPPPPPPGGNGPSGNGPSVNGPEGNGPSENPNNRTENDNSLTYLKMLQGVSNEKLEANASNGATQMSNLVKELVNEAISQRPDLPPIVANILKARGDSQAELLSIEEHNLPGQKNLIETQKKLLDIENVLIKMKLGFKVLKSGILVGGVAGLLAMGLGPCIPILIGVGAGALTGGLNLAINPNLIKLRIEAQKKENDKNKKDLEIVKLDMKLQKSQVGALNTVGNLIYGTLGTGAEENKKQFFNGINIKAINEGFAV